MLGVCVLLWHWRVFFLFLGRRYICIARTRDEKRDVVNVHFHTIVAMYWDALPQITCLARTIFLVEVEVPSELSARS